MQRLADIAPAEVRTIWGLLSAIPDPEVPVLTMSVSVQPGEHV